MDKDQIIAYQAEKIKDLEENISIFKRMITILLQASRTTLIKAEIADDDCADVYFSKFPRSANEFGFSTDGPFEETLYVD